MQCFLGGRLRGRKLFKSKHFVVTILISLFINKTKQMKVLKFIFLSFKDFDQFLIFKENIISMISVLWN